MRSNPDDLFCGDLPTSPCPGTGAILVTGATGYIGGRLVPELLHRGYHVRVMSRELSPEHRERWPGAEVVKADALQPESLGPALEGIHTAFYLIHPLLLANEMAESATVQAAANFRKTAEEKGISHVIYLGALGDSRTSPSVLLRQRAQVPEELRRSGIPVTALFSAAIIGSGSASYELIAPGPQLSRAADSFVGRIQMPAGRGARRHQVSRRTSGNAGSVRQDI